MGFPIVGLARSKHDTARSRTGEGALLDGCGRRIDHLRLSVIDECDLRCVYCRPGDHHEDHRVSHPLTDRQRLDLVGFLHDRYGLSQVRITGGEPLIYRGVVSFIAKLHDAFPNLAIAMTTHGRLLQRMSRELKLAGLQRINVSLDSLRPQVYARMTKGRLFDVLAGLDAAVDAGFPPPRINTVILRDGNEDEVVTLARWAFARGSEIRFLEAMPIGPAARNNSERFVSTAETRSRLERFFELQPMEAKYGETARRFRAISAEAEGIVGFISPVTEPFCSSCRRIRVTADGTLFPCLLDTRSVDLRSAWDTGCFDDSVADELLNRAVASKKPQGTVQATNMVTLGG